MGGVRPQKKSFAAHGVSNFERWLHLVVSLAIYPFVQVRLGPLGLAQVQSLGDLLKREGGFCLQPRGDGQLGAVAFRPRRQIRLRPPQNAQLLLHYPVGLGLGRLLPYLAWVVVSQFSLHLLEALLSESLAAYARAATEFLKRLFVHLLQTPPLHIALKFLPARRAVFLNSNRADPHHLGKYRPAGPHDSSRDTWLPDTPSEVVWACGQLCALGSSRQEKLWAFSTV